MRSVPHRCPSCDGAGTVSRPPHVAGDQTTWSDSGTPHYPCRACGGTGIIWSSDSEISIDWQAGLRRCSYDHD